MEDNDQVKIIFLKLTHGRHYDSWLTTKIPAFNMKTPQEMIDDGKTNEVIGALTKLIPGGYIDGE